MGKYVNIIGNIYNNLLVTKDLGGGKVICKCQLCGKEKEYYKKYVKAYKIKDCGCTSTAPPKPRPIQVGDVFNNWEVIAIHDKDKVWCRCKCAAQTERLLYRGVLRDGRSKSCGCLRGEFCNETKKNNGTFYNNAARKHMNEKHNMLTIIDYSKTDNSKFVCRCDCGTIKEIYKAHVLNGSTKSCGCFKESLKNSVQGMKFGDLKIIEELGNKYNTGRIVKAVCENCGSVKEYFRTSLTRGSTRSCGCLTQEYIRNTLMERYGETTTNRVHNPREKWQIETLNNKEKLIEYTKNLGDSATAYVLSKNLDVHISEIHRTFRDFGISNMLIAEAGTSVMEKEICEFVKKICPDVQQRVLGTIRDNNKQLELDMYIPSKAVAIEANGVYWHSTKFKDPYYHLNKTMLAQEKGIKLIHIFEHEWKNKKSQLCQMLYGILSGTFKDLSGNTFSFDKINSDEARKFMSYRSVYEYIDSDCNIVIRDNQDIIMLASFDKQDSDDSSYYMHNIAYDYRYNYKELLSAMLKGSLISLRNKGAKKIVTVVDLAKESEKDFLDYGFTVTSDIGPVSTLLDNHLNEVDDETESASINEIYDCGMKVLTYDIKPLG